jgi:hypothetical protein
VYQYVVTATYATLNHVIVADFYLKLLYQHVFTAQSWLVLHSCMTVAHAHAGAHALKYLVI